jgi:hypothetical protein
MADIETLSCADLLKDADDPHNCKCKGIVLNAYNNLIKKGLSDGEAIKLVVPVLRHHHVSPSYELKTVIECWVHEQQARTVH